MTSAAILLKRLAPFLAWPRITPASLRADLIAGITVSLVAIPQSLAYAQLAGVPPLLRALRGLHSGDGRRALRLIGDPVDGAGRDDVAADGRERRRARAAGDGPVLCLRDDACAPFGICSSSDSGSRARVCCCRLVSHPVLMGFINAAALIIALSQLPALMGISTRQSQHLLVDTWNVVSRPDLLHEMSLAFGAVAIVLLIAFRKFAPRLPGVLITVALVDLGELRARLRGARRSRRRRHSDRAARFRCPVPRLGGDPGVAAGSVRDRADQLHGGDVELQGHRHQEARCPGTRIRSSSGRGSRKSRRRSASRCRSADRSRARR